MGTTKWKQRWWNFLCESTKNLLAMVLCDHVVVPLFILMQFIFRGAYTFLHELGHVFGAHHDKQSGANNNIYRYGYGKLFYRGQRPEEGYRTIMA